MGATVESLGARLDARFDGLSTRIERQGRELGAQMYELGVKLDEHLRRHAG